MAPKSKLKVGTLVRDETKRTGKVIDRRYEPNLHRILVKQGNYREVDWAEQRLVEFDNEGIEIVDCSKLHIINEWGEDV